MSTASPFSEPFRAICRAHHLLQGLSASPSGKTESLLSELYSLYDDSDVTTQYKIITGLVEARIADSRQLLLRALVESPSALVRHEAAFGLGVFQDKTDAEPLAAAMLRDLDSMVRHEAAVALASLRDPSTMGALSAALQDPETAVVESAAYAISEIKLHSSLGDNAAGDLRRLQRAT
jgi:HEAT repeat protein